MSYITKISEIYSKSYKSNNLIVHLMSSFFHYITIFPIYWIIHSKDNFKKLLSLKKDLKSQNRNVSWLTLLDATIFFYFFGYFVYEYETYYFEQKSFKERFSFASEFDLWKFVNCFDNRAELPKLVDKEKSYNLFKEFYKRDVITIKSSDDFEKYTNFYNAHPVFFVKPLYGAFGRNSGLFDSRKFNSCEESFNSLVKSAPLILEELIIQCKEMAAFNPSSINTVRTTVLRTKNGLDLLFGFIRNGRKGVVVDNGGAGGIFIPYDCNTGKLCKYGFDECGNTYSEHPDSGIKYNNFLIPRFNEIKDISFKLMEKLPKLDYVGFDIAIRDDDIVIVEANHAPQFVEFQAMHKLGFKKELEEIIRTDTIPLSFRTKQNELFY